MITFSTLTIHISCERRRVVWQRVSNVLEKNYYFHLQGKRSHEEGRIKFLKALVIYLWSYTGKHL